MILAIALIVVAGLLLTTAAAHRIRLIQLPRVRRPRYRNTYQPVRR